MVFSNSHLTTVINSKVMHQKNPCRYHSTESPKSFGLKLTWAIKDLITFLGW